MRMLIIDDSRAMRRLLSSYAQELAFDTVEASDGQDALNKLQGAPPFDLALVDWDMPVMDGITFVERVRSNHDWDAMKLMMVTAQSSMEALGKEIGRAHV